MTPCRKGGYPRRNIAAFQAGTGILIGAPAAQPDRRLRGRPRRGDRRDLPFLAFRRLFLLFQRRLSVEQGALRHGKLRRADLAADLRLVLQLDDLGRVDVPVDPPPHDHRAGPYVPPAPSGLSDADPLAPDTPFPGTVDPHRPLSPISPLIAESAPTTVSSLAADLPNMITSLPGMGTGSRGVRPSRSRSAGGGLSSAPWTRTPRRRRIASRALLPG